MEEKGTMHVHLLTELTGNLYSEESECEEDCRRVVNMQCR